MSKPVRCRGKWRIRWIDHERIRRSEVYSLFRDAELALSKNKVRSEETRLGLWVPPPPKRPFPDLAKLWLETRAPLKRSRGQDESIISKHLLPFFEGKEIDKITQLECDHYVQSKKDLSPKTVANHITLLLALLNHAARIGWITKAPPIKKPRTHILDRDFHYLRTNEETIRLLLAAKAESEFCYFLYFTAIHTGLRAGELAALRWDDIDLGKRLITVQRSYDGPTKSGRVRYVPILDPLAVVLLHQRDKRKGSLVFPNSVGNMLQKSDRIFQETLHRVLDRADFPRVNEGRRPRRYIVFHDFRHTFASRWVLNGGDIYRLQSILGHASIAMTMRYAHLGPNAFANDLGRFGSERSEEILHDSPDASVSSEKPAPTPKSIRLVG